MRGTSDWAEGDGARKRRVYRLTQKGQTELGERRVTWSDYVQAMQAALASPTPFSTSSRGSARPRAVSSGAAETVFDDLTLVVRLPLGDRLPILREAGRLALAVAGVAAAAVALAGIVAGNAIDGALRALVEAAVLGCYRLLGARLGP